MRTVGHGVGSLEERILAALQCAQPHGLSMLTILEQTGVFVTQRKLVDSALSKLIRLGLAGVSDANAVIPEYFLISRPCDKSDEFSGFQAPVLANNPEPLFSSWRGEPEDTCSPRKAFGSIKPMTHKQFREEVGGESVEKKPIKRAGSPVLGLVSQREGKEGSHVSKSGQKGFGDGQEWGYSEVVQRETSTIRVDKPSSAAPSFRGESGCDRGGKQKQFHQRNEDDFHTSEKFHDLAMSLAGKEISIDYVKTIKKSRISMDEWQKQAKNEALSLFKAQSLSKGERNAESKKAPKPEVIPQAKPRALVGQSGRKHSHDKVEKMLMEVLTKIYPNATTIGILSDAVGLEREQVSQIFVLKLHPNGVLEKMVMGKKQPPLWRLSPKWMEKSGR
ncbi:hypothetical protein BSKO_11351 [Bryopsis sp. KO-2023]|nr:hypothetical protein BSKO_11351 [Bryopsis sp. KO-2023]